MVEIKNEGVILEPVYEFEKGGVFNPACVSVGDEVWMYYRAVSNNDVSTIGFCKIKDDMVVERQDGPILAPEYDYEAKGLEDPRITCVDGTYYLFYTAYDGKNAQIAYATTKKLPHFQKQGLVFPKITYEKAGELFRKTNLSLRYKVFEEECQKAVGQNALLWEKDAFLFPEKIDGKFALGHRILPGIQIIYFKEFKELTNNFWHDYLTDLDKHVVIEPKFWFDSESVGGGCPPLKTEYGWLLIYHTVEYSSLGRCYHAAAALLDLDSPKKVVGRLSEPLFSPELNFEKKGIADNVVFPTTILRNGDRLKIYYGAADRVIALRSLNYKELIDALRISSSESKSPELIPVEETSS
ncbi:MAG: pesticidal protein Cry7Aa [Patescibacteria group bacterium]|nr:pesticidal protein Cry7Aa [Patescibacteria group bacterium]